MPFEKFDVNKAIENRRLSDPNFRDAWDSSRTEYHILGQLIKLRKQKGLSQADLAKITGHKQQAISRIEMKENSPTLNTLCNLLDALEVDLILVPREAQPSTTR